MAMVFHLSTQLLSKSEVRTIEVLWKMPAIGMYDVSASPMNEFLLSTIRPGFAGGGSGRIEKL